MILNPTRTRTIVSVFSAACALCPWSAAIAAPLFLAPIAYNAGGPGTEFVAVADVNGDGRSDLIVAVQNDPGGAHARNGLVAVFLGNGDGTFQPPVTYDSGGSDPFSLAIADLNGDGAQDIVVANFCVWIGGSCSSTTIGVLLGRGDGTFDPVVAWNAGGNSATSVAVGDVNRDGKPDIVFPIQVGFNFAVGVLLGNGDGTFQPPSFAYTTGISQQIALADLNRDGALDVVLAGYNWRDDGQSAAVVSVLIGHGDGTFEPAATYDTGAPAGTLANSVAVGDLNGDGVLDLAVAVYATSTTAILLGNGNGTFAPAVLYGSGGTLAWSETIADVNGDGKADVIVAGAAGTIGVLLGNGNGTFQPVRTFSVPAATSIAAADVNGDGRLDLLVTTGNDAVSVLLNSSGCDAAPVITLSASPGSLWPPNGKMVPVIVSGRVADGGCGVNASATTYAVQDEYAEVQPAGPIELNADGRFSFTILLRASRNDRDGRLYTITVRAENSTGAAASSTRGVRVPHDRGGSLSGADIDAPGR